MLNKFLYPFLFFVFCFSVAISQNQPPNITSDGNQIYCPQTQQNIVSNFNIEDPDDTSLDALYIQISEGYIPGEDILHTTAQIQIYILIGLFRRVNLK